MSVVPETPRVRDRIILFIPTLILALLASLAAYAQFTFSDHWFLRTSVMGYPPRPLELARTGSQLLFLLPVILLILGCLSFRWRWLGGRMALVVQAGFVLIGNLVIAYMMLFPASWLGYFSDSRLPHSARKVFEEATAIEVIALQPGVDLFRPRKEFNETNFHGYAITAKVAVTEPTLVSNVVQSVYRSIDEAWMPPALCFNPHHGVNVKSPKREMHLVVCYECGNVYVFFRDQEIWNGLITSSSKTFLDQLLRVSASPR